MDVGDDLIEGFIMERNGTGSTSQDDSLPIPAMQVIGGQIKPVKQNVPLESIAWESN